MHVAITTKLMLCHLLTCTCTLFTSILQAGILESPVSPPAAPANQWENTSPHKEFLHTDIHMYTVQLLQIRYGLQSIAQPTPPCVNVHVYRHYFQHSRLHLPIILAATVDPTMADILGATKDILDSTYWRILSFISVRSKALRDEISRGSEDILYIHVYIHVGYIYIYTVQ